ncbi:MAG: ATP-binding cassette domain-containing protein, partial [FCB group bacterium]
MNQTSIEISNLTLKFSKYIALDNINLTINKNTFLSIVGPNGAGKSTLLKVILGLIPPGTGTVKIFDKSPDDVPPQLIGYVPQIKTLD